MHEAQLRRCGSAEPRLLPCDWQRRVRREQKNNTETRQFFRRSLVVVVS